MLPLDIFASRQFTVINVITFCVYAAFGGELFLLVLELQVGSKFSALAAGSALLPITVLMLVLSPRSAALAQRIGPRWPLTAGSALCATGLLLATRIGVHASYLGDVLPAVVVFGLGLTLVVSPLTATVLASADVRHAGVASGVNNAVARAAGLLAVAGLPAAVGLHTSEYHSAILLTHGFRLAMIVCAGLLVLAGVLAVAFVDDRVLSSEPEEPAAERVSMRSCPVEAPQLGYREPSRAGEPS
jgi:MFS family permease